MRNLLILCCLLASIVCLGQQEFTINHLTYVINNNEVGVKFSNADYGNIQTLVIPDYVSYQGKKYNVTSIKYGWENVNIDTLKFGKNIIKIGNGAFYRSKIKNIILNEGLKIIEDFAFEEGINQNINIPSSVQKIGEYAFEHWGDENNYVLKNDIYGKERKAYLNKITFGDTKADLGKYSFSICKVDSLILPDNIGNIPEECFYLDGSYIEFGESTTTLKYPFYSCFDNFTIHFKNIMKLIGGFGRLGSNNTVIIDAPIPPLVVDWKGDPQLYFTDNDIASDSKLIVPRGSLAAYKTTKPWSEFNYIYEKEEIHVNDIKIVPEAITLNKIGQTMQLNAIISPNNADNKNVIWDTTDRNVAIVSRGKVVCTGFGTAVITAITEDGGYMATCIVNATNGITVFNTNKETKEVKRYDVNGYEINTPANGINIIKTNSGQVIKTVHKK